MSSREKCHLPLTMLPLGKLHDCIKKYNAKRKDPWFTSMHKKRSTYILVHHNGHASIKAAL